MLGEWRVKNIADRGSWKASIFPKGQLLIPSGPPAFLGFSSKRTLKTSDRLIVKISEFLENGGRHASGLETCIGSRRAVLIIFAVSRLERTAIPSRWRYDWANVFATSSLSHTRYHHDLIPPLAGFGGLKIGDFGCIVLSVTQLPLTISDVTKVSKTLSITLRICLWTRLNKSFKLRRHPRSVIYVKFNGLERHDDV